MGIHEEAALNDLTAAVLALGVTIEQASTGKGYPDARRDVMHRYEKARNAVREVAD